MSKFELYIDTNSEHRWRLVADNGRIMADSAEGYSSREAVEKALTEFRKLAQEAEVIKEGDTLNG